MDNDKADKNIFKFSKRFYFQVLIFLVVACVHFYITPMFEVELNFGETPANPKRALIWLALIIPNIFIFENLGIINTHFVSSLLYGMIGALLISEKIYLRVISIILIVCAIYWAYLIVAYIAMGD